MFTAQGGVYCSSVITFSVGHVRITSFLHVFQVRFTRLAGRFRRETLPKLRSRKTQQLQAKVQNKFVEGLSPIHSMVIAVSCM